MPLFQFDSEAKKTAAQDEARKLAPDTPTGNIVADVIGKFGVKPRKVKTEAQKALDKAVKWATSVGHCADRASKGLLPETAHMGCWNQVQAMSEEEWSSTVLNARKEVEDCIQAIPDLVAIVAEYGFNGPTAALKYVKKSETFGLTATVNGNRIPAAKPCFRAIVALDQLEAHDVPLLMRNTIRDHVAAASAEEAAA